MAKQFASQGDLSEKKISFTEIGRDLWALSRMVRMSPVLTAAFDVQSRSVPT